MSKAEQLDAALRSMTTYTLGQLASRSCEVDVIDACAMSTFTDTHRTAKSDALLLAADTGTATVSSSAFTKDRSPHAYEVTAAYAVAQPGHYTVGDKLSVEELRALIDGGTIQTLACKSTTPSASSAATVSFDVNGNPAPPADEQLLSRVAACMEEVHAALTDTKTRGGE